MSHFRIKELKDVLDQLGLSKQGKKQDLVDRVMAVLLSQQDQASEVNGLPKAKSVVKIVEDTFRKMQEPTNTVAASRSHESGHSVKPKRKPGDSAQAVKVRCPCGDSKPNDSMIKAAEFHLIELFEFHNWKGRITKRIMPAFEEMPGMDILCSDKAPTLALHQLTVNKISLLVVRLQQPSLFCHQGYIRGLHRGKNVSTCCVFLFPFFIALL